MPFDPLCWTWQAFRLAISLVISLEATRAPNDNWRLNVDAEVGGREGERKVILAIAVMWPACACHMRFGAHTHTQRETNTQQIHRSTFGSGTCCCCYRLRAFLNTAKGMFKLLLNWIAGSLLINILRSWTSKLRDGQLDWCGWYGAEEGEEREAQSGVPLSVVIKFMRLITRRLLGNFSQPRDIIYYNYALQSLETTAKGYFNVVQM